MLGESAQEEKSGNRKRREGEGDKASFQVYQSVRSLLVQGGMVRGPPHYAGLHSLVNKLYQQTQSLERSWRDRLVFL